MEGKHFPTLMKKLLDQESATIGDEKQKMKVAKNTKQTYTDYDLCKYPYVL